MQYEIELNTLPNQTFTTTINNVDMEVVIKLGGQEDNQILFFALIVNNEYLCPFVPVFANQGVLPYEYMVTEAGGQFFFETENDEYPNYKEFGVLCKLYFVTLDELNG